ncbi:GNAT family N-acetyltransferase [Bradyrhizobium sp. AUGA SZCCT0240]|uniref:GNAT family N-acetyltransferase n=1 Tax=unclassified Bradyrhizobium TaxID=2631580 RepID=UPI001BA9F0F4|nr:MULTISPECIES: GNAT family N-acetyltransferase [unclassified Bradyrhizobium]MBR1199363.1 GNAT family N-acetyltransferase [Bradyrhizobium sp. AUGA SZCCT0158]MBR1241097.1 GNAT family N-acetyltransferase [Bradyrhizobium sp. AUGA SZCCT0274]MBR1255845.1 GNAT family N-acetyltransferase [Bradyrhizobium sp. AUGA SZCCT0240]
MTIEVRQIREEDIESFHAAIDAVAREHRYLALLEAPPIERATAFVRRNIENGYPQLVAITNGQVVGWCNIPPASREVMAHVGDLFMGLLPNWRGQGLGERLLRESLVAADAFGYLRIELGVFADNSRAAALYRKAGFVEEGLKRRAILIDSVFHDEIIMARLRD